MLCRASEQTRENRSFWLQQIKYILLLSVSTQQKRTPFLSVCVRVWQTKIKTTYFVCCYIWCRTHRYMAFKLLPLYALTPYISPLAQHIKLETLSFIIMTFYEYGILSFHFTRHTASLWHQHGLIRERLWLHVGLCALSTQSKVSLSFVCVHFLLRSVFLFLCVFIFLCVKCGF